MVLWSFPWHGLDVGVFFGPSPKNTPTYLPRYDNSLRARTGNFSHLCNLQYNIQQNLSVRGTK